LLRQGLNVRLEYLIRYGRDLHESVKQFLVLGVTLYDDLAPEEDIDLGGGARLHIRNMTWQHLASYRGYPSGREFADYLEWRIQHAKLSFPEPLPTILDEEEPAVPWSDGMQ
jgi:hypothetical protein